MFKTLFPYLQLFVAMCSFCLLDVLGKKLKLSMPTFMLVGVTMVFIAIMGLSAHFLTNRTYSFADIDSKAWGLALLFSVVNFIGFAAWMGGVSDVPVYTYRVLNLVAPVIVALLGYWILRETVDWKSLIIGLVIISSGIYIVIKNNF